MCRPCALRKKAHSTNFLLMAGSAVLVGLRASTTGPFRCSRGRCSPVQKFCSSSEDSYDGKELLRHQRQSKRMEYTVLADVVHLFARLMADARGRFPVRRGAAEAHGGCMPLEDHSPRQACRFIARHNVFSPSGSRHTREDTVLWLPSLRPHC